MSEALIATSTSSSSSSSGDFKITTAMIPIVSSGSSRSGSYTFSGTLVFAILHFFYTSQYASPPNQGACGLLSDKVAQSAVTLTDTTVNISVNGNRISVGSSYGSYSATAVIVTK